MNDQVDNLVLEQGIIQNTVLHSKPVGELPVRQLQQEDAKALYHFYYSGLSKDSRELFFPYPLFSTPSADAYELSEKIAQWKNENTWSFFNVFKGANIVGVALLKRLDTDFPTSGLAISERYQGKGLGKLLQRLVIKQAQALGLERLYVKIDPRNEASRLLHERLGYQFLRHVDYVGFSEGEKVPMQVIELVLEL